MVENNEEVSPPEPDNKLLEQRLKEETKNRKKMEKFNAKLEERFK